ARPWPGTQPDVAPAADHHAGGPAEHPAGPAERARSGGQPAADVHGERDGGAGQQPGGQHAQWDDDRRGGERGGHVPRFEPQQDRHGLLLTATATGLNATSSGFTITPGAATQLVFGTQPGTTVAGQQITPAVKLRALDALGNVATGFTGARAVALGRNPGGARLRATLVVPAGGGGARFGERGYTPRGRG